MSTKILVADESPTIHKIVAMAFENEGITVEGISRGEHALEYMVGFQPDIVLADIHLPGTDGYELCRQIKNSPSFGSVRVILLTSDFEDIDKVELEISRADDYISKPFKTEEILKKVKSQLATSEVEKEAPEQKEDSPQEAENSQVIQDEFEDIINQPKETTEDALDLLFAEGEDTSLDEIELEDEPAAEPNVDEVPPEIILDKSSEEAFRAETRPVKVKADDLNSAFQSVLSSPQSGSEDAEKPKPGTKPNLIEETLSFIAAQHFEEEVEPIPEPMAGEVFPPSIDSADQLLGDKIIQEHMDQVMDQLPEDARHGNSQAALEKTVREVLGEVAPNIIRKVIQEEIETIKKMKEA